MKNIVAWIKSIYWLPVLALVALLVSAVFAVFAVWSTAFYLLLVGVFFLLLGISGR